MIISIVALVFNAILSATVIAWVVNIYWGWFIESAFNILSPGLEILTGLVLLLSYFGQKGFSAKKIEALELTDYLMDFIWLLVVSVIFLFLGYIVHIGF